MACVQCAQTLLRVCIVMAIAVLQIMNVPQAPATNQNVLSVIFLQTAKSLLDKTSIAMVKLAPLMVIV